MNLSPKFFAPNLLAQQPPSDLHQALKRCLPPLGGVAVFSAVLNILALTGSLYMLQVYDRVLSSRCIPTLVGLTIVMIMLYAAYGALDFLRARIMIRIAIRFDRLMRERVFSLVMMAPLRTRNSGAAQLPLRDLDQIRTFMSSHGPTALFDMPWLPFYLTLVFLLHPLLGLSAIIGATVLVLLTLLTEARTKAPARASMASGLARQSFGETAKRNAEVVRACGLTGQMNRRWGQLSETFMEDQQRALDVSGGIGSVSKVFRLVLQSIQLGLGAYVVIGGDATGGVMIAASILTSRALAPIEAAIANWRNFIGARQSYHRLSQLMAAAPAETERMALPGPQKSLSVEALFVGAPGDAQSIVKGVSFSLVAGDGLGIIGPSASGKSTLARALAGAWLTQRGAIRLDGATLDQWAPDSLGRHIGYLPQDIELFDGSVAENIARLDPNPESAAVIAAAQAAGVHELILRLSDGYETRIGEGGAMLSAGQRQRIALARALYGDPFLLVLDEPNSNLDSEGDEALTAAIASVRARGGVVIVIAHRSSALAAVDKIAALANGQLQAFGPKAEILARLLKQNITVQPGAAQRTAKLQEGAAPPAVPNIRAVRTPSLQLGGQV
jgi:ATP-binding cassette, subfamily C, bacterial PrsD